MAFIPYRGRTMPGATLASLRDEMNELLNRFWSSTAEPFGLAEWSPPLDMAETDDAVLVNVEIPGIEPKDLDISVTGDVLTIRGEKRDGKETEGHNYLRVERRYGAFTRTLALPAPVDAQDVEAKAHAGVLEIRLPKKAEAKPRQVEIRGE
jgi:HSP20 family protein